MYKLLVCLLCVTLLVSACGGRPAATQMPVPSTSTLPASTPTSLPVTPTITLTPPITTSVLPTATLQPTATPMPPLDGRGGGVAAFYSENSYRRVAICQGSETCVL